MFIICIVPYLIAFAYLFSAVSTLIEFASCISIIILFFYIAYKTAFNDFDIWIDVENQMVLIKRNKTIESIPVEEFMAFKLSYMGMYMSTNFKYYLMKLNGKDYRIRYYKDKVTYPLNPFLILNMNDAESLEQEMKGKIISLFPDQRFSERYSRN